MSIPRLVTAIQQDDWMMRTLGSVQNLALNDGWIGAGFVRNKIWDAFHPQMASGKYDIDVIYYDCIDASLEAEQSLEERLSELQPLNCWSVKNQARMHVRNHHTKYRHCLDAIRRWPETATAIAVRLGNAGIEVLAPYGVDDLFGLIVRKSPLADESAFRRRLREKRWLERWPRLAMLDQSKDGRWRNSCTLTPPCAENCAPIPQQCRQSRPIRHPPSKTTN